MHTRLRVLGQRRYETLVEGPGGSVTAVYTRWYSVSINTPCRYAHVDPRCDREGGVCPRVKQRVTQYNWGCEVTYPHGREDPPDCGSRELPAEQAQSAATQTTMLGESGPRRRRKRWAP